MAEKTTIMKKLSTDRDWKLKIIAAKLRINQQDALDKAVDDLYDSVEAL